MKHLFVLTFAVVAALCIAISQGVSSKYGFKGMHDQMLHRQFIIKSGSWWKKTTRTYRYPPTGYSNNRIIHAIYLTDQTGGKNTSTGHGSLSDGGPGYNFVVMHFKAPRNCPLNFTMEIYA
ncbi:probable salivary secreted peptide [Episyrphus balteatus]|uniref:probable salivary secreted peptide n=1 Tax=Episyrphus balteatus TaxID=286459 RepID=UPI00248638BE|nr:probable salivary secreted peptide [Episyrphus balteatus]